VVFAVRARGLRGGRLAAVGAACFVLALGWGFAVVNTANAEVGRRGGGGGALGLASLAGPVGVRTRRPLRGDVRRVPGAAGRHRACRRPGSPACPWSLLAHRRQPCPMARAWKALPWGRVAPAPTPNGQVRTDLNEPSLIAGDCSYPFG